MSYRQDSWQCELIGLVVVHCGSHWLICLDFVIPPAPEAFKTLQVFLVYEQSVIWTFMYSTFLGRGQCYNHADWKWVYVILLFTVRKRSSKSHHCFFASFQLVFPSVFDLLIQIRTFLSTFFSCFPYTFHLNQNNSLFMVKNNKITLPCWFGRLWYLVFGPSAFTSLVPFFDMFELEVMNNEHS